MAIESYNFVLALGVVVMQILTVAFLVLYIFGRKNPDLEAIGESIGKWGLWIGFLVALAGSAIALFYSDILGIGACGLCWLQRVFLFPQIVMFALALFKKDRAIADYSIALSVLGALIALYQHYLQMGGTSTLPCPATAGEAVDCAVRFLFEFNYITFPLAAFSVFAFLIVIMLFVRRTAIVSTY
jgi:disulfide bond formation protein DsbB